MDGRGRLFSMVVPGVLLLAGASQPLSQVADDIDVSLSAETRQLTVGDPVTLTLRVTHPPDYQVILPRLPRQWGRFEVRSQSGAETIVVENGGQTTTSQSIEVTLFAPGTFETPAVSVTVRDPDGRIIERQASPLSLTVVSVLTEDDVELRDIRGQASLPVPALWPWLLGGLLLAGLVGAGLFVLVQRRPRRGPLAQPGLDRRSAYEIALDELARIERLDLPGQERFKEHYTLVSDCVRRYIDREYRIPAIDQTTDEVRSELRRTTIVAEHSSQAVALLRDCDLVKFAKFEPEVAAAHQTTGQARRLVGLLRLVPADLTLGPEAAEPSGGTP